MAFVITEKCLSCGSCAEQCPAEAISEGEERFEINPEKCLSCGSCAAQCPAEAIIKVEAEEYVAEEIEDSEDIVVEIVELPEEEEEAEPCYKIDYDKCLSCGSCAEQCPAEAIAMDEDSRYVINPEKCARCGSCAEQCPAEAISLC